MLKKKVASKVRPSKQNGGSGSMSLDNRSLGSLGSPRELDSYGGTEEGENAQYDRESKPWIRPNTKKCKNANRKNGGSNFMTFEETCSGLRNVLTESEREKLYEQRRKQFENYVNELKHKGQYSLGTEVERCLKKVCEGIEGFDKIWEEALRPNQAFNKDKHDIELKKEVKKLQKLRDQIKAWIPEVIDSGTLYDARKLIETQMERQRLFEKETRIKTYSTSGLRSVQSEDPMTKEKNALQVWLNISIEKLQIELNKLETNIEGIINGKKKNNDLETKIRLDALKSHTKSHNFHIGKLETLLRILRNIPAHSSSFPVFLDQVKRIQDDIEYYIEASLEPGYENNEYLYDDVEDFHKNHEFEIVCPQEPILTVNIEEEEEELGIPDEVIEKAAVELNERVSFAEKNLIESTGISGVVTCTLSMPSTAPNAEIPMQSSSLSQEIHTELLPVSKILTEKGEMKLLLPKKFRDDKINVEFKTGSKTRKHKGETKVLVWKKFEENHFNTMQEPCSTSLKQQHEVNAICGPEFYPKKYEELSYEVAVKISSAPEPTILDDLISSNSAIKPKLEQAFDDFPKKIETKEIGLEVKSKTQTDETLNEHKEQLKSFPNMLMNENPTDLNYSTSKARLEPATHDSIEETLGLEPKKFNKEILHETEANTNLPPVEDYSEQLSLISDGAIYVIKPANFSLSLISNESLKFDDTNDLEPEKEVQYEQPYENNFANEHECFQNEQVQLAQQVEMIHENFAGISQFQEDNSVEAIPPIPLQSELRTQQSCEGLVDLRAQDSVESQISLPDNEPSSAVEPAMSMAEESGSIICMVEQDLKLIEASRSCRQNVDLLNFFQAIGLQHSSPELQGLHKKLGLRKILADINKLESLYLKKVQEIYKFLEEIETDRDKYEEYIQGIHHQISLKEIKLESLKEELDNKPPLDKVNEVRNVLRRQNNTPTIARELDQVIQKYQCLKKATCKFQEKEKFYNDKRQSLKLKLNQIEKNAEDKLMTSWVQLKEFATVADCKWNYLQMKKAQILEELNEFSNT